MHFLVREHLCLLHRHSVCVHTHTHPHTQGSSDPLARRCQESTFCSVPDQTPGRGSLCHDVDTEDESSVLHVASLGFWKTRVSPGTMCLCAGCQVTVITSVLLGKHHGVCSLASLQSTVVTRRKSSSFCSRCTSGTHFSSSGRRRRCHLPSGTGMRRCFPEGRS